jgi:hypothetical protein
MQLDLTVSLRQQRGIATRVCIYHEMNLTSAQLLMRIASYDCVGSFDGKDVCLIYGKFGSMASYGGDT